MSQETAQWLNTKILYSKLVGEPWWMNSKLFNPENCFEGYIPREAIEKLFGFTVNAGKVWVENSKGELFLAKDFIAMVPDSHDACYGIHSDSFQAHQLKEWLVDHVWNLVNGRTGATSAGLLRDGAQAWVQISTPDEWKTPQGVDFRTNLLCFTGFDGKRASTYKLTHKYSICDNTVEIALKSDGKVYRVKHTKNSAFNVTDAQAAFGLIQDAAEAHAAQIADLCSKPVTEAQFNAFMAKLVPLPTKQDLDINRRDYSTRTATIAANKREKLNELYRQDGRVAPWQGTAFGVLQMVNTFSTHFASQRGKAEGEDSASFRVQRNQENVINGKIAEADYNAYDLLAQVCNWELNKQYA